MQRSLCPVSPDAEKGLKFELHYLLVVTAFPMSLRLTVDNSCSKKVQSIAVQSACLVIQLSLSYSKD